MVIGPLEHSQHFRNSVHTQMPTLGATCSPGMTQWGYFCPLPFTHALKRTDESHVRSTFGFSVMPKDTSACSWSQTINRCSPFWYVLLIRVQVRLRLRRARLLTCLMMLSARPPVKLKHSDGETCDSFMSNFLKRETEQMCFQLPLSF